MPEGAYIEDHTRKHGAMGSREKVCYLRLALPSPAAAADVRSRTAVLHGSVGGRTEPGPSLCLSDPDGLRASKLKHAVQGSNGDGNLRLATAVRS
jgi:hypothetical protein